MLKKNLVRAGFFGPGLLLVFPVTGLKSEPYLFARELNASGQYYSKKDTSIADLVDSTTIRMASSTTDLAKSSVAPTIKLNKNAIKFVQNFLKREDEALVKVKGRSRSFFPIIDEIFTRYNLPLELKYLAIVESDLKTNAVSRVGAKGMWQFMPTTARELGLKVNGKYDERTHMYRSTVAAAKYLKALYSEFGDWLLALAAYNGGPGTVYKAIKKSGSRNFWALQSFLPEESRGHVKRFIGTHYYFEGKGSLTTMTKAETIAYNKLMEVFLAEEKEEVVVKEEEVNGK